MAQFATAAIEDTNMRRGDRLVVVNDERRLHSPAIWGSKDESGRTWFVLHALWMMTSVWEVMCSYCESDRPRRESAKSVVRNCALASRSELADRPSLSLQMVAADGCRFKQKMLAILPFCNAASRS